MSTLQTLEELPEGPVQVAVVDIDGIVRGKRISKQKLLSAAQDGFGFCNVVFGWDVNDHPYDNSEVSGWHTGYPDAHVRLDLSTLRNIPWQGQQAFLLGDFSTGTLAEVCPRSLLKRVLAKAEQHGFGVNAALEYEWFNFEQDASSSTIANGLSPKPITQGMHGYSLLRPASKQAFVDELWSGLAGFDVPLEGLHTETGPGVYEAAIHYTDALSAADRAVCFKLGTKQLALKHNMIASFMAKWSNLYPGCGGHLHQSLTSLTDGSNLFLTSSQTAERYLAGQLHWLPYLMPFFAPTVNSYKRFVSGSWAATTASWGKDNRTTAVRQLANRIETRVPGADANPYLVLAAAVAAGLYGIEHQLKLPAEVNGNAYENEKLPALPKTLHEATASMKDQEQQLAALFGSTQFVRHFIQTRVWECRQANEAVTDWELKRYFEII